MNMRLDSVLQLGADGDVQQGLIDIATVDVHDLDALGAGHSKQLHGGDRVNIEIVLQNSGLEIRTSSPPTSTTV